MARASCRRQVSYFQRCQSSFQVLVPSKLTVWVELTRPRNSKSTEKPMKFVNTSHPKARSRRSKKLTRCLDKHDVEKRAPGCESTYDDNSIVRQRPRPKPSPFVPWDCHSSLDPFALFPVYMEPYMYKLIHNCQYHLKLCF
jgi:hypothetical protein